MELSLEDFKKFEAFLYRISGIRLSENKQSLLANRLRKRLKALKLSDFRSYYQLISSPAGSEEIAGFLNVATTNETSFFRTEKHFEWLRKEFLPECIRRGGRGERSKEIRFWSAACSTGEEAYSIAICLAENQLRLGGWKLQIIGTDISEEVLQRAHQGIYSDKGLEGFDEKQVRRFFGPASTGGFRTIQPHVRNLVSFSRHNLLDPWAGEPFDVVFLRNVLIYFDRESKRKVLDNVHQAMNRGAYLVLGPSEGVFDMLDGFSKSSPFLYRKQG